MFTPKEMALERGWPGRIDGDRVVQLAAQTLQAFFTGGGAAREHAEYPLADVDLRAPVMYPGTIRVFEPGSLDFAFGNTAAIYGPGDEIPFPQGVSSIDAGLGLVAVMGDDAIGGFTLANTWRAPGLPGAKSRDFALSTGPVVVTDTAPRTIRSGGIERPLDPDWDAIVAHAACNTKVRPGALLVVDAGPCGFELRPGDVVEIEAEGIGVLRNRIV
jgi:fumarylacetoacetate (FAA) hydrolase